MSILFFPFLLPQNQFSLRFQALIKLYKANLEKGNLISFFDDKDHFNELFELRMFATHLFLKRGMDLQLSDIHFEYLQNFPMLYKQVQEALKIAELINTDLLGKQEENTDFEVFKNLKYQDYVNIISASLPTKQAQSFLKLLTHSLKTEFAIGVFGCGN
jgi:hypothetical protein